MNELETLTALIDNTEARLDITRRLILLDRIGIWVARIACVVYAIGVGLHLSRGNTSTVFLYIGLAALCAWFADANKRDLVRHHRELYHINSELRALLSALVLEQARRAGTEDFR